MRDIFMTAETYTEDKPLFEKLGLKEFSYDIREVKGKYFVGEVKRTNSTCKIWVCCLPAQFWIFEIYCDDSGKTTIVGTGSDCLSEYWDIAEKMMDGMFVVDKVTVKGK